MRKTNSEKIEKKQTYVLPTLKYFFPAAWKTDKAFFILSVIHVIVTAAIPFAELFFLPTIIDAMMAPEKDLAFIFTNAAIMTPVNPSAPTTAMSMTNEVNRLVKETDTPLR